MKKIRFYKNLIIEIVETLCTICMFLERESIYSCRDSRHFANYFRGHFSMLKGFSEEMRKEKA